MKKLLSLALCAAVAVSALAGCGSSGGGSSAQGSSSQGGGHAQVTINFPTADASGALYAVGAAITNLWDTQIDFVSASSQASNGGIDNLTQVSEGEAQVSIAISSNCYECLNGQNSFEGYAYDDQLFCEGLRCVAAPICGPGGKALFSISVSAPSLRMDDARYELVRQLVVRYSALATAEIQEL